MIVRPDPEDPSKSSKLSLMLQSDIKGWVPHFVVNAFAARAPMEWRESLANYYFNVYTKSDKEGEGNSPVQQGGGEGGAEGEGQSTSAEGDNKGGEGAGGDTSDVTEGQSTSADKEEGEEAPTPEGETKGEDNTETGAAADQ